MNGDAMMWANWQLQVDALHAAETTPWRSLYQAVAKADAEALARVICAGISTLYLEDVRIAHAAIAAALAATDAEPGSEPDALDGERRIALATLLVARQCGDGSCRWRLDDALADEQP